MFVYFGFVCLRLSFCMSFLYVLLKGRGVSREVSCGWQRWAARAWVRAGTGVSQLSCRVAVNLELVAVAVLFPAPLYALTPTAFQIEVLAWQQHAHYWMFAGDLVAVQQSQCYGLSVTTVITGCSVVLRDSCTLFVCVFGLPV